MLALCMAGSLLTGCGTSADAGKKSKDSGDVTTVNGLRQDRLTEQLIR